MIFKGVLFALGACLIWGLIFIIPDLFMKPFTSIEVALGRYLVYGTISSLIFFKTKPIYPKKIWIKALYFSLVSTFIYYTFVVLSVRYATPAICALILGISPITIALYGNWKEKETSFKNLLIPSFLILIGLVVINTPHFETTMSKTSYVLGLIFSLGALLTWSWYVVANSRFLKDHPHVHSSDWSTLIGVSTLFWFFLFALIMALFFEKQLQIEKYFIFNDELKSFLIGSAILGLLCSWMGAFLWNKASLNLPVSLAGQLTVFETIFGVVFFYGIQKSLPSKAEIAGISILLLAIVYGIKKCAKKRDCMSKIDLVL